MDSDTNTPDYSGNTDVSELPDLSDPALFINRELSWIEFNRHVLDEAKDTSHPLLERVKFLSIFANNLDEFFMVRVSGLHRQVKEGVLKAPADGLTPNQQLDAIYSLLNPLMEELARVWFFDLVPALSEAGIHIHHYEDLSYADKKRLREFFITDIFPVLTPLAFDKSHPFPFISNLSLNLAIIVKDREEDEEHFARVKIPTSLFSRLIKIPKNTVGSGSLTSERMDLVFIEDVISANIDLLFPGMEVFASYPFRITRDADIEIEEDEADDLITAIEEYVGRRQMGTPVRIEVSDRMDHSVCLMMGEKLAKSPHMFYMMQAPVGMADVMCLYNLDRPDLKDTPFVPSLPARFENEKKLFTIIRAKDTILFHPYESFQPVVSFLQQAARDPDVLAIKMTLYRTGVDSPIVRALLDAREHKKAVSVIVELKARFDEENNIGWARALEHAGVHVVYGLMGLKVHAKLCMVVRREREGIVRYVHMSSGNYNSFTSRIYTDIGLFTANDEIASDVSNLFNQLTGYSRFTAYNHLMVAPKKIRRGILGLIGREITRQKEYGDGKIIIKINALQDREIIQELYRASQAGVDIQLQVRGICCLRPGIPNISEKITVNTIVGRFLEHSRIYYFHNGGDPVLLLGSADMMPRNLNRRIEVLFPVLDPAIKDIIIRQLLPVHLNDTVKSRYLCSDGTYKRTVIEKDEEQIHAQLWMLENRGIWNNAVPEEESGT
ncbi:MAG: polyphosphate kinase 1 [Methanospirillaceae archaeon]|nr:polyphosphate kinase 1 [Methanospirillaceae archaeon]